MSLAPDVTVTLSNLEADWLAATLRGEAAAAEAEPGQEPPYVVPVVLDELAMMRQIADKIDTALTGD